jgi:hypothetical protein
LTTILSEALTLGNDLLEIFYSQDPIHCAKKQMTGPNKNVIALQETKDDLLMLRRNVMDFRCHLNTRETFEKSLQIGEGPDALTQTFLAQQQ